MLRNSTRRVSFWRLVAMLPVILIGFISIIGSGGNSDDGDSHTRFEEKEPFSFDVVVGSQDQLNLLGVNGEITITGESGADSVLIAGVKRVQSSISAQDAKDYLPQLEVDWESLANEINVETIQPQDTADRNYRIDYTLTLPSYFKVEVNSINGVVTLDSIDNDVAVSMANGNVALMNIHGSASVALANGTIESDVILPLNGTIDLSTATGNIHLDIPSNTSAEFSATVLFGNINDSNLVFQNEERTPTSLSGTLGSGQGTISLNAMRNISVSGF